MNLIGISGYISSGKDTVGKIIQYWDICNKYPNRICPFVEEDPFVQKESSFRIKKFATKLKEVASILTGFPAEKFEDQEFKKTYLSKEWNQWLPYNSSAPWVGEGELSEQSMTVREFLQKLGTEAVRNNIHENAWVNALFADYQLQGEEKAGYLNPYPPIEYPNWIITDCRFPNEAQAIKDRGGIIVRVNRFEIPETLTQWRCGTCEPEEIPFDKSNKKHMDLLKGNVIVHKENLHPSETSLDNWSFDYIINNHSTIEDLTVEVKKMLEYFNLLS